MKKISPRVVGTVILSFETSFFHDFLSFYFTLGASIHSLGSGLRRHSTGQQRLYQTASHFLSIITSPACQTSSLGSQGPGAKLVLPSTSASALHLQGVSWSMLQTLFCSPARRPDPHPGPTQGLNQGLLNCRWTLPSESLSTAKTHSMYPDS